MTPSGRPRFFVSHGTMDRVLPIDECSRVIVPRLKALDYDVTTAEFEGRHEVPRISPPRRCAGWRGEPEADYD